MIHFFTMLNTIRLPDKNELRMKLLKIKHKTFISSAELPSGFEKCGKKWAGLSWAGPLGSFPKRVTNKQMKYQKKRNSFPGCTASNNKNRKFHYPPISLLKQKSFFKKNAL